MKNTQIPKIIHYCWFGRNPLPPMAIKCIESWKKFLPDYEIKEWNEDNFDITITPYVEEAYRLKKYAFVSDFARFWVLYNYGGIYFDVDVELLKPIDDILARGPYMGLEGLGKEFEYRGCTDVPNAGLGMAVPPQFEILKSAMQYYYNHHFISPKGVIQYKTVVLIMTDIILEIVDNIEGDKISLCAGIYLYPEEYFNPKRVSTGKITITDNTRSIHHYAATWVDRKKRRRGLPMHWERFKTLMIRVKIGIKHLFRNNNR